MILVRPWSPQQYSFSQTLSQPLFAFFQHLKIEDCPPHPADNEVLKFPLVLYFKNIFSTIEGKFMFLF